jgi:hypothetical protein
MKPIKLTRFIDGQSVFLNPDLIVGFAKDPNDPSVTRVWCVGDNKDNALAVCEWPEVIVKYCDPNSMAAFEQKKAAA